MLFFVGIIILFACKDQAHNTPKDKIDSLSEQAYNAVEDHLAKSDQKKLTINKIDTIPDDNLEQVISLNISSKVDGDLKSEYFGIKELSKPQQALY